MSRLATSFTGLQFVNPFVLASAPPTESKRKIMKAFESGWGGVVTKTIGLHPVENVAGPKTIFQRTSEAKPYVSRNKRPDTVSHSSWNWELISDQPLDLWLPDLEEIKTTYPDRMVIASIMAGAGSAEEMENWAKLARAVVGVGCDAIELNMSCPHMDRKDMGANIANDETIIRDILAAVKGAVDVPIWVKLTPATSTLVDAAGAAYEAGASIAHCHVRMEDQTPTSDPERFARLKEALEAHCGFLSVVHTGRPMVTLKTAASLDGRIATASGESQWITGPSARRLVHGMRARHDAVLVGAGTARADDPSLTVRGLGMAHQPVRVVVSRRLDVPVASALGRTAREVPVWLIHGAEAPSGARVAWSDAGARLIEVATVSGGQVDMGAALRVLAEAGLTRVFCEGGGALAATLLAGDLVDRLAVFNGGLVLGAEGTPSVGAMGIAALAEAPKFRLNRVDQVGTDTVSHWRRNVNRS